MLLLLSWTMVGFIYMLSTNSQILEKKKDDACYEFISFLS